MAVSGHIYILINPSMPGLLKIGKTCRTSDIRAGELSGDTGVPADFIVAFEVPVSDCDAAESGVHRELANFRFNQNREFFKLRLRDAVQLVSEIAAKFPVTPSEDNGDFDQERGRKQSPLDDGLTPLHRACLSNDSHRVAALLARGADPDSKTEDGVTPLMVAAGKGHSAIVDILIRAGAKVDAVATDGSTANSIAKERGHVFALNVLNHYRRAKNESEFIGADQLNQVGEDGSTPLMRASARKDTSQVEALLRKGADPNAQGKSGEAPLDIAAKCGATKVAEVLLRHGARSPNAAGLAEGNGHFVMAELLRRATPAAADGFGDEPDGF